MNPRDRNLAKLAKEFLTAADHMLNAANDRAIYEPGTTEHKKAVVRYIVVEMAYNKRANELKHAIKEYE